MNSCSRNMGCKAQEPHPQGDHQPHTSAPLPRDLRHWGRSPGVTEQVPVTRRDRASVLCRYAGTGWFIWALNLIPRPRGARKALFLQDREDLAAQAACTRTRTFTSTPETFQYTSQKARGGQTSIKCVFTPGKLRLLPTTSLPPSLPKSHKWGLQTPLVPTQPETIFTPFFF